MRKLFFIAFTLLLHSSVRAQKTTPATKWSASLTGAFIPLPGFNPGIQPGVEYRFNKRVSLLTEITIRVGNKDDRDSMAMDRKYFRVQPELRYTFLSGKRKRNNYAGLRLSWALRKFADVNSGFYSLKKSSDDGFFYDKAKINSPVITSSLQLGTVFRAGKKISIDVFTGLGLRFINTTYSEVVNPVSGTRLRAAGSSFYASYSSNGHLTWFHMNAGLRVFFHLKQ